MDEPERPLPPPPPPPSMPPPSMPARPRPSLDFSGAFQFGWDAFRRDPGPLVGAVVITYVVVFVVMGLAVAIVALLARLGGSTVVLVGALTAGLLGFAVFTLAAQLPTVVLLRAGVDALDGRPVTLDRIFRTAGLGRLLAAMLLVILGVLVGYVFLVLPGIVFGVLAGFTLHHMIEDERLTPIEGIRASIDTIRGAVWPSLGVILVTGLVAGLGIYACGIGLVVSLPVAMIAQVHGFRQVTGRPVPPPAA